MSYKVDTIPPFEKQLKKLAKSIPPSKEKFQN